MNEPIHPISFIRDLRHPSIRSSEKNVLWALASRMRADQMFVYAEMSKIAGDAGMEEGTARRVMNWLVKVGAVVEVPDPTRRTKVRRIDFEALAALPVDVVRNTSGGAARGAQSLPTLAQSLDTPALRTPSDSDATLAQRLPRGAQSLERVALRLGDPSFAHPEDQVKSKEEQTKNNSARVPRRGAPIGSVLPLDSGPTDPSTPATIPATPAALPETSKASSGPLPVNASNPPPKGTRKAGKKPAGKLTESQAKAHTAAIDCWHETFIEYKNEKPIITGKDIKDIDALLGVMQWDIDKTCALIKSAFTHVWFREKNCSIAELVKKPSTYQIPVQSERRSFGQVEPDESFWTNRDNELAEDYGS